MDNNAVGDSFIFILKGHGKTQGIICSDGKIVTKMDIMKELNNKNCKNLVGKPLILFCGCRGSILLHNSLLIK
jgi:hypothetical protein